MGSLYNGSLEWGQDHLVENCYTINDTSDGGQTVNNTDLDGNMYSFEGGKCNKTDGPSVKMQDRVLTTD